ncbi:MAG: hypothetical protein K2W82_07545 [Candidatus Obscuribacterales bacterium]|nr:hypothetical protein [Candidatus Obscuribacterales bacterium]
MSIDLSFILEYNWASSTHLKEALRITLSAYIDDSVSKASLTESGSQIINCREYIEAACCLAGSALTSEPILAYLAKMGDVRVLALVAEHPQSNSEMLTQLAKHINPDVRAAVAANVNCPINVLYDLSRDSEADVRYMLAEDPRLPISILEELSMDENPYVASRASKTMRSLSQGVVVEGHFPRHDEIQKVGGQEL